MPIRTDALHDVTARLEGIPASERLQTLEALRVLELPRLTDEAARELRASGATWSQVAEAAGLHSRQAAWERWGSPDRT
jgi:hypothetical protein